MHSTLRPAIDARYLLMNCISFCYSVLVLHLVQHRVNVDVWVQIPFNDIRTPSRDLQQRILTQVSSYALMKDDVAGRLRIFGYEPPAAFRCVLMDDAYLAVGHYVHHVGMTGHKVKLPLNGQERAFLGEYPKGNNSTTIIFKNRHPAFEPWFSLAEQIPYLLGGELPKPLLEIENREIIANNAPIQLGGVGVAEQVQAQPSRSHVSRLQRESS
jgi:hypothetical protein